MRLSRWCQWFGLDAIELTYKEPNGRVGKEIGGDGSGVLLQPEDGQRNGRAIIEKAFPEFIGSVGIAAREDFLHSHLLLLIAAKSQRPRLAKG